MAKIYLSPSTQTYNTYAGTDQTGKFNETDDDEMHWMQRLRDVVQQSLIAAGHAVKTHNYVETLSTQMRDANAWGADYYIALHSNAGGGKGMEVFAYAPGGVGEILAKALYKRLEPLTPHADRGVKFANFAELRETNMPAALVELDFHDNVEIAKWIRSNIGPAGRAIALGICDVAGGSVPDTTHKPEAPKETKMAISDADAQKIARAFATMQVGRQFVTNSEGKRVPYTVAMAIQDTANNVEKLLNLYREDRKS